MKNKTALILIFSTLILSCFIARGNAKKQVEALSRIYREKMKSDGDIDRSHFHVDNFQFAVETAEEGQKEKDRIGRLPGQPAGSNVSHFGGYVTVNIKAGRALYYYFVEARNSHNTLPLLLWLNGGPGCSSLAYGAMQELGPFRVHSDGKTLYTNKFAWNHAANVLFLESPAGVGFSYSNTTADFIGNAVINDETDTKGMYEYFGSHALISDDIAYQIKKYCDFSPKVTKQSVKCIEAAGIADKNIENIDIYNIYAPLCSNPNLTDKPKKISGMSIDPCSEYYVHAYLNRPEVQKALHANVTNIPYDWQPCSDVIKKWQDSPSTVIPLLKELIANGLRVWIFRLVDIHKYMKAT
ncbi:serine carboxypeptidase [Striga asiatica]|uniref:Serine carboxypeptidase n=1 Tax=Striga asiatica TaxID=4170 RepID=A0A5A7QUK1_STRAF|nr:serine carboxypeptidase [Striga asiatica]